MWSKPTIGIPADHRLIDPHPFHAVGEKYIKAIVVAGGYPNLIPVLPDLNLNDVLERLDGLFLTGSPSNIEPHHYNGPASRDGTWHDPNRDALTLPLLQQVIDRGIPLLSVCRGFQEMNVALGGTLHQHVHEQPGYDDHREVKDQELEVQYGPAHSVQLVAGGLLAQLTGRQSLTVNSLHSQGIHELAPCLKAEAHATDGLVEAFVHTFAPGFTLGVQWHPEWKVEESKESLAIFNAFIDAATQYASRKRVIHGSNRPVVERQSN
ncbi:MAG: gamma-glutamyl-gamma-aminobutyrate hydrolase family protein [Pseudomonadota bacterium]